jgi:acetolactate synthase regulatory subunit
MQLIPGTAQPRELRHLRLVVDDRPEVPARIAITCLRRQGTIVALAYERGLAGGAARLDVAIEVSQRHARLLEQRLEQLVEVRELRAR